MPTAYAFNHPKLKERRRALRHNPTDAEEFLWRKIRNKGLGGLRFWRQYSVGSFILDFYCPAKKLAIELDGGQHAQEASVVYDKERTDFLRSKEIYVLRFWNNEIFKNTQAVLEKILSVAGQSLRPL
ncbi:MAG: endonuclease domain-containing protein [bacterium]|nr:endonuclease domain-containing protein [bacterium]